MKTFQVQCVLLALWSLHVTDALIKRDDKMRSPDEPAATDNVDQSKVMTGYRGAASAEVATPPAAQVNSSGGSLEGEGPSYVGTTPTAKNGAAGEQATEIEAEKHSQIVRIGLQLFWGVLYYFMVVRLYPHVDDHTGSSERAKELQEQNELSATLDVSMSNFCLSWVCPGPRGAHTFHSLGLLNYWLGCILMSALPCCTLWYMNSCTSLNEKLGGEREGCCMSFICAFFFFQCVIAQDAESLDAVSGTNTRLCGVVSHTKGRQV